MGSERPKSRARARADRAATRRRPKADEINEVYGRLKALHPDARCELDFATPFQLLVATVLSAQTTDRMVNAVTPALFARFADAAAMARASVDEVERLIARIGFFRQKARNVVSLSQTLVARHGGEVPRTMGELTALAGVGRKTANVVLGNAFGCAEGVVVDTHVQRVSQRLGWVRGADPANIERELTSVFAASERDMVSHVLIFHGRRVCNAQRPACATCGVRDACPSAGRAASIGRKPPKKRPARRTPPADG